MKFKTRAELLAELSTKEVIMHYLCNDIKEVKQLAKKELVKRGIIKTGWQRFLQIIGVRYSIYSGLAKSGNA